MKSISHYLENQQLKAQVFQIIDINLDIYIYIYVHTHLVTQKRKKIESVTIIKKIISGLKMIWFPPG